MKILVLNGPNLNLLGKRREAHYGSKTLDEINETLTSLAQKENISLAFFQSNHEGELIDYLQENAGDAHGLLINPGALTHYGLSLRDAVEDSKLPTLIVHLSDVKQREDFRKVDVFKDIAIGVIAGLKEKSYTEGLVKLIEHIQKS